MNNPFLKALAIVAICYFTLKTLSALIASLYWLSRDVSYWMQYRLLPYIGQIALAVGVVYLLYTALARRSRV